MRRRWPSLLGIIALLGCCALGVIAGLRHREATARCPPGLTASGPRCCGLGQRLLGRHCEGHPRSCAAGQRVTERGCIAASRRVRVEGGTLVLAPDVWEALGKAQPRERFVRTFWLDSHEVTQARYHACEDDPATCPAQVREPGLAQTGVTPLQAEQFCARHQGRLPSHEEWMFAASSRGTSRYPWGPTGLVCRRATFGLVDGPCGVGLETPEVVGSRPAGASREGLFDLSGNAAEWVSTNGRHIAAGGSFRSAVAGQLKFWSARRAPGPAADVGFRCAYSSDTPKQQDPDHPKRPAEDAGGSPASAG